MRNDNIFREEKRSGREGEREVRLGEIVGEGKSEENEDTRRRRK